MAVIKNLESVEEPINYIASLALLCCVSCVIIMLKFGGFKATFNLYSRNKKKDQHEPACLSGAYRTSRDEFFGYSSLSEPPKKISPSMVAIPTGQPQTVRPSKSTGDLTKADAPANLRQSNPAISLDPRGAEEPNTRKNSRDVKKQEKEQKKIEKQRLAEQKARDKLAAQERVKQEKLRKEREQKEAQIKKEKKKKEEKKKAPAPPSQSANPLAQGSSYTTNTLESSISKSSGPPPYSEELNPEPTRNRTKSNDKVANVSFSKPIDSGGNWDMITQHRQQISRPTAAVGNRQPKQMVMDLNYNFGENPASRTLNSNDIDNSEA